MAIPT
jgi:hypothetical protein